jgi:translation initiation factor 1
MAKQIRGGRDGSRPEGSGEDKGPEPRPDSKTRGFHNPFARLEALRDALPSTKPQVRREDFPDEPPAQGPERAVVRLEAGRGGQEVTVVEGLGLPAEELQAWLQALQRGLACTGSVEGERLVLRGDHRFKLPDLLLRRGVKRVVQG